MNFIKALHKGLDAAEKQRVKKVAARSRGTVFGALKSPGDQMRHEWMPWGGGHRYCVRCGLVLCNNATAPCPVKRVEVLGINLTGV